jgi:hypothetical protein
MSLETLPAHLASRRDLQLELPRPTEMYCLYYALALFPKTRLCISMIQHCLVYLIKSDMESHNHASFPAPSLLPQAPPTCWILLLSPHPSYFACTPAAVHILSTCAIHWCLAHSAQVLVCDGILPHTLQPVVMTSYTPRPANVHCPCELVYMHKYMPVLESEGWALVHCPCNCPHEAKENVSFHYYSNLDRNKVLNWPQLLAFPFFTIY